ncbi:serine hydrolase domain-containing protein [Sphingobium phenoxybenzoativorans]|uniref:serine hydrolase domain-containing protein n=1 Tax=Sphingobium phenoxybenzoativorans TaxID=1592790 RepID=UPI000871CF06|nr:serine hydrolase domain-containing protein [Sphingobium phenoxybenzoativorans]
MAVRLNALPMTGVDIMLAKEMGFDPARLAQITPFLRDRYVDPGLFPHAQILVSRHGRPVLSESIGAAREDGTPLAGDALFRLASMTKPVTSVAFMMLVEQGMTTLDQPVQDLIPELRDTGVYAGGGGGEPFVTTPAAAPMLLRDLLRHTSGLTYGLQQQNPVDQAYRTLGLDSFRPQWTSDQFMAVMAEPPLLFSPGASWNYSMATDVLGVVVERLSGISLEAFFADRIFGPLGMADSFFQLPDDRTDRLTDAWSVEPGKPPVLFDRGGKSRWRMPDRFYSGGAGLLSSAADYHRFCRMLLCGGALDGVRLLSPETVALMTANHLPGGGDLSQFPHSVFGEPQNAGIGFGLGFAVTMDPAKAGLPGTPGEFYWDGLFSTSFFIDPVEHLICIFMTQVMPSFAFSIRRELKALIYSALSETYL